MQIFNEIKSLRKVLFQYKIEKRSIGLVPTMGALHSGHLALINESKKECDVTICSIYVNPTQFNNSSDLENYPKTLDQDLLLLEQLDCDIVFCPKNQSIYANGNQIRFDFGNLDKVMEGEFRENHFSGVAMIVSKFFNIIQPNFAYFGQKDLQQFVIVKKLVDELLFNITLRCVPIVREENGLAMSSRNMRLTENGKKEALILYQSLTEAREELKKGGSIPDIKNKIKLKFAPLIMELEYFEVVNTLTLETVENITDRNQVALCIAGYIEKVRLIDNVLLNE